MKISTYIFITGIAILLAFPAHAQVADIKAVDENGNEKNNFLREDSVYIKGQCVFAQDDTIKIYIYTDKNEWVEGEVLYDKSGGIEMIKTDDSGNIPLTLVWQGPLKAGSYDLIVDTNVNGKYDIFEKCIDDMSITGFTVGTPPAPQPVTEPEPEPAPLVVTPAPVPTPIYYPPQQTAQVSQPKPSMTFSLEDTVSVKSLANVRASAGGTLLGQQSKGEKGTVVGGPVYAKLGGNSFWFWNINYESSPDGWTAEETLEISEEITEEEIIEEEILDEEIPEEPALEITESADLTATSAKAEIEQEQNNAESEKLAQALTDQGKQAITEGALGGIWGALIIGLAIVLSGYIIGRSIKCIGR